MVATIEGSRTFEREGERYTVTVSRRKPPAWEYRVDSVTRGSLDRGTIAASDPWGQLIAWFPEIAATTIDPTGE